MVHSGVFYISERQQGPQMLQGLGKLTPPLNGPVDIGLTWTI